MRFHLTFFLFWSNDYCCCYCCCCCCRYKFHCWRQERRWRSTTNIFMGLKRGASIPHSIPFVEGSHVSGKRVLVRSRADDGRHYLVRVMLERDVLDRWCWY
jgi:hypothetical protein